MSKKGNFTVVAKSLKNGANGLISYSTYLQSKKPKSHENTDILNLYPNHPNYREFCNNTIKNVLDVQVNNTKGGRAFNSYGTSFVCSLPPTVKKPTQDEWRAITKQIVRDLHGELFKQTEVIVSEDDEVIKKDLNFKGGIPSINDFAKSLMLNVHDQKNPHLNIIIPSVYGGERLKRVDQKSLLNKLKKTFTTQALLVVGIDYDKYEPVEKNLGKRRKQWQLDQDKYRKEKDLLSGERLKLAEETLAAAQLIDQGQKVQEDAETAVSEAQVAIERSKQAKAEADRSISLLHEMKNLYNNFKTSITAWANSIRGDDMLLEDIAENEVIEAVETVQKHKLYDDEIEIVIFSSIEQAEIEAEPYTTEKKPISSKVRRKRKYTI